ncbi:MAG: AIM24 family protein [Lachnospiraceae bacterium]|nr:AIM24 family protein [Lachnospiraceae bacterium]
MRYSIEGETLPVVICELDAGETMPISKVADVLRPYFPSSSD